MEFTIEELKLIEAALVTEQLRLEETMKKTCCSPFQYEKMENKKKKLESIFNKIDEERKRLSVLNDIENKMEGK